MSTRYSLRVVMAGIAAIALAIGWGLRCLSPTVADVEPGTFLLSVERVYESEEDIVVRLRVDSAEPLYRQVWSPAVLSGWLAAPEQTPAQRYADATLTGEIWIFGSSFLVGRERWIKTVLGEGGSIRHTRPQPPDNPRLYITITSGAFPTGRPIRIGHVDGEPVFLAVGQPKQLIRLKALTMNQPALAGKTFRRAPCHTLRSV